MTKRDQLSQMLSRGMEFPEQRNERLKRTALKLGATGLTLLSLWNGYWQDVRNNEEAHEQRTVQINDYSDAPKDDKILAAMAERDRKIATVVFGGYDSYNSRLPARIIGIPFQNVLGGEVWTVDYMNAPLDIDNIAEQIVDKAGDKDIDDVVFVGPSSGGSIAIQVQEKITERNSLDVPLNVQVLAPDGLSTLREDVKGVAEFAAGVGAEHPSLLFSTPARIFGEFAAYAANISLETPIQFVRTTYEAVVDTSESLSRPDTPDMPLRFEMLSSIADGKAEERIGAIAAAPDTVLDTAFLYLGTTGYDHVVNEDVAGENKCQYAHENGFYCEKHDVEGAVHGKPHLSENAYAQIIYDLAPELLETIEENEQKRAAALDRHKWRQQVQ